MTSLALNLLIAVIWLFLGQELSIVNFVVGYLIGFALLAMFRDILKSHSYIRRSLAAVRYFFIFLKEFLHSCWRLMVMAVSANIQRIEPRLLRYDVKGLSKLEIMLLTHSISLTPGTTTVEISPNFDTLLIHALDTHDPEQIRRGIDQTLRRGILAFTR